MLPNPYKVRRKWRRQNAEKKDFSFHEPKAPNPYREKKQSSYLRRWLLFFLGVMSVLAMTYLLFTHPFFAITTIEVTGTERLSAEGIQQRLHDRLHTPFRGSLPFSRQAYVLVSVRDVHGWLMGQFSLEKATVTKEFPNTLRVQVVERLSNVILDDGISYQFVDLDGGLLDTVRPVGINAWENEVRITTTTLADGTVRQTEEIVARRHTPEVAQVEAEAGNYPILVVLRQATPSSTPIASEQVDPLLVARTIEWYEYLTKKTDIPFLYVEKSAAPGPYAAVMTREGWRLLIPLHESAKEVTPRLEAVLTKHIPRRTLQYIDLRYPGLVYWK